MVHKIKNHGKIYISILLSPYMLWAFFIDTKSVFCRKKKREQNALLPLPNGKLFF
ncbi:hypothetical protein U369_02545 [Bacillus anthracis 52-G]|uniref:Uncharacterized protein n=1 Tax=Bacillus phage vB_BanS_Athena TaxID=2894785 RepID=A0AAE8YW63_9CAUD|nr:hypothetical protein P9652_gp03 [Bacillus phage vB_BanS_Athena]EVT94665.1 hypothetical protein U368_02370 [Bacillus anthracis 8903-G]EVU01486.1 hypothetical protein U365_06790 [Bacillus anthracis 9080-G]EVU07228.1 hypothetical protein U369_02545 [Bacillus anthracis 52-G]EXJ22077.1 hypothetical protein Y693_02345 [Bacillus anthracis str. 95014]UGO51681.1 hypothetical protein ATHENA_3 [Bacillus phage vB_BanS_Athena]